MASLKFFLFAFVVAFSFLPAPCARADGTIPPELSALILSPDFAPIVTSLNQQAMPGVQRVSLADYQISSASGQVTIALRVMAESLVRPGRPRKLGTINANIAKDKAGTVSASDVSFDAAPATPGGASVGN